VRVFGVFEGSLGYFEGSLGYFEVFWGVVLRLFFAIERLRHHRFSKHAKQKQKTRSKQTRIKHTNTKQKIAHINNNNCQQPTTQPRS
jgi:hypothetical protein